MSVQRENTAAGSDYLFMIRAYVVRMLLLLALWWLLSEASVDALWIGVPTVALAAMPGLRSRSGAAPRVRQLLRFGPAFIARSLFAGVDVAARALRPDMGLHPALLEFRTDLPPGTPRVFFANLVSLLPGTLSADIEDCRLQIHVLDDRAPSEPTLRQLEGVVARLFNR